MRSSVGLRRRSAPISFISSTSARPAVSAAKIGLVPCATYSGSPRPRMMFVWSKTNCVWLAGMPIMSQMIPSGSGAAIFATKSHSPWSITASTSSRARRSTSCCRRASARGVKPRDTMLRSRAWRGSSMRDHRAEELVHLHGQVGDVHALAGAEEVGAAARRHHVRVPRHRPVAGAARQRKFRRRLELLVKRTSAGRGASAGTRPRAPRSAGSRTAARRSGSRPRSRGASAGTLGDPPSPRAVYRLGARIASRSGVVPSRGRFRDDDPPGRRGWRTAADEEGSMAAKRRKAVSDGRYAIFQMAEVAVPRELFRRILDRIARLRSPDAVPC